MEGKWLDDYLALSKSHSFTEAAASRNVTQPAFSRRIRALENWLGVKLVDRSMYPTTFTEAGIAFSTDAAELRREILASKDRLQSLMSPKNAIKVIAQHSLAVAFVPSWLQAVEQGDEAVAVKVEAGNFHDSLELFLSGTADFLLCFTAPHVPPELARPDIEAIRIGSDRLLPVTALSEDGVPLFDISGSKPLNLLTYPTSAFFGRLIFERCLSLVRDLPNLQLGCESALADGLKALVSMGYGVAWLPECLILDELEEKQLGVMPAPFRSVELDVSLCRFPSQATKLSEQFWGAAKELQVMP